MSDSAAVGGSDEKELVKLQKKCKQLQEQLDRSREYRESSDRGYEQRIAVLEGQIEIYKEMVDRLLRIPASVNTPAKQ